MLESQAQLVRTRQCKSDEICSRDDGASGPGRAETRIVGCNPDTLMLLISKSHEKQTAKKPRASPDKEVLYQ